MFIDFFFQNCFIEVLCWLHFKSCYVQMYAFIQSKCKYIMQITLFIKFLKNVRRLRVTNIVCKLECEWFELKHESTSRIQSCTVYVITIQVNASTCKWYPSNASGHYDIYTTMETYKMMSSSIESKHQWAYSFELCHY